jgi:hypothetical protein
MLLIIGQKESGNQDKGLSEYVRLLCLSIQELRAEFSNGMTNVDGINSVCRSAFLLYSFQFNVIGSLLEA